MPPKKVDSGKEAEGLGFSGRDAKMASLALKLLPPSARASINFEAFVAEFGQKDVKSAKECFRQISKKHGWFEGTADGTSEPATPTPKKTPAKRSTAKKAATDDDEVDIEETPTKRRKGNPKKTATVKDEVEVAANGYGEIGFLDGIA